MAHQFIETLDISGSDGFSCSQLCCPSYSSPCIFSLPVSVTSFECDCCDLGHVSSAIAIEAESVLSWFVSSHFSISQFCLSFFVHPFLHPPFVCLFFVHHFPVFSLSSIMSALSNYLAASDGSPRHSRSQARDSDPFARWAATSPLGRRGHVDQASPLAASPLAASTGSAEDNEGFTPLTPAPRRPAPQPTFSGPTPAQRRRRPSTSPPRALDSEHASSPTTRLGRRAREPSPEPSQDEERAASDSLFRALNVLSPRSRKKRRGIARSVSATFGLPEAALDQFAGVCCHRT